MPFIFIGTILIEMKECNFWVLKNLRQKNELHAEPNILKGQF